ncbi:HD-GYP domain-containing protein [Desulfofalx alkaliphila]|uniref:HD-GYP domain-containing protein n=1 Tax=Desulfofalx alkaliphila TaxID=105483 RepID=UPI001A9A4DD4|nr:HD-GYP domain-containing protein [Desulfofalx alkaliphila]
MSTLNTVSTIKDVYLTKHHQGVCLYTTALAKEMKLPDELYEIIHRAAALHDIGKIGIPNNILFKKGKLTPNEWKIMRLHPVIGAELLSGYDLEIIRIVRHHHERWDGRGYPDGLKGGDIPLGARAIAVSDAFDAMTTERPYQRALDKTNALAEIIRCAGSQFDPEVVKIFINIQMRDYFHE